MVPDKRLLVWRNHCLQIADFKARLEKLKIQRAAFLEKKARQRQQAGLDVIAGNDAGNTEDEQTTMVKKGGAFTKEDKSKSE
eukprot:COSAG02_NODE_4731_length_5043_cov_3.579895_4_plen_82_part_00